jgi:hypothetical protein
LGGGFNNVWLKKTGEFRRINAKEREYQRSIPAVLLAAGK